MTLGQNSAGRDLKVRYFYLAILMVGGLLVLGVRLFRLQITHGEEYAAKSVENFEKKIRILADRGMIRDARGEILVDNRPSFDVFATPAFCQKCSEEVLPRLAAWLSWDAAQLQHARDQMKWAKQAAPFQPTLLRVDLARDELDPLNASSRENLGQLRFFMGRYDEAAADFKKALELNPDARISHFFGSLTYVMKGRAQDALAEIEGERNDEFRLEIYAIAYHALGREKESDAALSELIAKYHTVSAYPIAEVYAFRNQPDKAFEWLERAYAQHDGGLPFTNVDPLLKSLHSDPRYAAFLKKLKLPA